MSRLGPLAGRGFRLLFLGRTVSVLGSAIAPIGLAFAVLDLTGSKADLGYVLAARALPQVIFLLFGGVLSDRLPRHHVMVASSIVSGASQLAAGALVLAGGARIWELAALAAVNGTSSAFFFPASTGVLPQVVPLDSLQQANALLRLGINATTIVGASIGGLLVAATSPGVAILVDGVTFALGAVFIGLMHLPPGERVPGSTMLHELRVGWREFSSRTWLWAIVVQFSVVNAAESGAVNVLGPAVSKAHFGGAAWWGAALTAQSLGLVLCGTMMLRYRPRRILLVATLAIFPMALFPLSLARPVAAPLVVLAGFLAGFFVEIFGVLWDTAMQQEIPHDRLSRVSAYDAVGSYVFTPLGLAVVGPVAQAFGTRGTLLGAAALVALPTALVLLSRDVRTLTRRRAAS
ncbi:MAG TPA: MFS transporter [Gaiellaceae bacterium]|nr:MFS transporter [Gaiellaceae bacterium]